MQEFLSKAKIKVVEFDHFKTREMQNFEDYEIMSKISVKQTSISDFKLFEFEGFKIMKRVNYGKNKC
jgi:hypothetical protein